MTLVLSSAGTGKTTLLSDWVAGIGGRSVGPGDRRVYAQRLLQMFSMSIPRAIAADDIIAKPLTARELEVLALICEGYSNQGIAEQSVVALNTVKKQASNVYGELRVRSRTQAIARARDLRLG